MHQLASQLVLHFAMAECYDDPFEDRGTCAECGCLERDGNHFADEQLCTRCDVANNAGDMSAAELLTAAQEIHDAEESAR